MLSTPAFVRVSDMKTSPAFYFKVNQVDRGRLICWPIYYANLAA